MSYHGAGIFHVHFAPAQVQRLAVGTAITRAAPVIQVGYGKATLGPELDTRVEHRIAGRRRATVDEHHQGWALYAIHGRIEETMGLAIATGVAQCLRPTDAVCR